MKLRYQLSISLCIALAFCLAPASSWADGKKLFKGVCAACHTIGGGKRVGPDLKGVTKRRTRAWLASFIKSSQKMVKAGDPTAVKLFNEYNKMIMPDTAYTTAQIGEIIDYLGGGGSAQKAEPAKPLAPITDADVKLGQQLFTGEARFAKGGPSCNSCHLVRDDAVIGAFGGGVLAKEITHVFGRMGHSGVGSILGKPPFPVMQAAYEGKPLTEKEKHALIAFLQSADKQKAFQTPADYGWKLFGYGCGGFVVLLLIYAMLWRKRKQRSVNQAIYDRQIRSV